MITWLVVRWVRTREQDRPDDRLLLLAGVVTALTMQVKFLIPAFWLALGISVLALGPRDLLRRPKLWAGAGVTLLVTAPTLVWQAQHGWPYLALTKQVSDEMDYVGGRYTFLPFALLLAGVAIGAVLACYGLWRLLRSPDLAPYRFLGATTLGVVAIMIAANGRPYYAQQQRDTVVVGDLYWTAAAADRFGPGRGLPRGLQPQPRLLLPGHTSRRHAHRHLRRLGRRNAAKAFRRGATAGKLDNGAAVDNNTQGSAIWVCEGPRAPWPQLWPQLRTG